MALSCENKTRAGLVSNGSRKQKSRAVEPEQSSVRIGANVRLAGGRRRRGSLFLPRGFGADRSRNSIELRSFAARSSASWVAFSARRCRGRSRVCRILSVLWVGGVDGFAS